MYYNALPQRSASWHRLSYPHPKKFPINIPTVFPNSTFSINNRWFRLTITHNIILQTLEPKDLKEFPSTYISCPWSNERTSWAISASSCRPCLFKLCARLSITRGVRSLGIRPSWARRFRRSSSRWFVTTRFTKPRRTDTPSRLNVPRSLSKISVMYLLLVQVFAGLVIIGHPWRWHEVERRRWVECNMYRRKRVWAFFEGLMSIRSALGWRREEESALKRFGRFGVQKERVCACWQDGWDEI